MKLTELENLLLNELGYTESQDLNPSSPARGGRAIPHVYKVYSIRNIPVAYFARLADVNPQELWELQRNVWSESKVPILYVILPHEIRIYNGYAEPAESPDELANLGDRLLRHLTGLIDLETARRGIRAALLDTYDRLHLETGGFWATTDGQKIRRGSRADQRLLGSMGQIRRHLLDRGVPNTIAYSLIGRAILIRYLIDRGVLESSWFSRATGGRFADFIEALTDDQATLAIFEKLTRRFRGDLFPIEEQEKRFLRQPYLSLLRRFLSGEDLDSGQRSFWPYAFQYIPIELISEIYDTFLKTDDRRALGAFYTPLALVDFIINESLPREDLDLGTTVLDPACGSGVFLVRAYQRLVNTSHKRARRRPNPQALERILREQIYGIDKAPEAVRIAAFSLYIALLDFLTVDEINSSSFRFPPLIGSNLLMLDFFSSEVEGCIGDKKFDRIIGNPPWGKGTINENRLALDWIKEKELPIGGGQIVQAFLWRAPDFCVDSGEIALLAPAKSTILVTSQTHEEFRREFFVSFDVRAVVNFSALVYELFPDSLSPAVVMFYRPSAPDLTQKFVYGAPKPSLFSQHLGAILLESTEVKFIDRDELLAYPALWKVSLWGTPRDAKLIKRLIELPTLLEISTQLGWDPGEGMQENGGDENPAPWAGEILFLPTDLFEPFVVPTERLDFKGGDVFHRPRTRERYEAPLVLIHQSRCKAAFSSTTDVVYLHSITGVRGKTDTIPYLKWLTAYINSPLARYYQFLTSSRWAVERGNPLHEEYMRMPFILPKKNDNRFATLLSIFDELCSLERDKNNLAIDTTIAERERLKAILDDLVFQIFGLSIIERQLVVDLVTHEIDFFRWSKQKNRRPGQALSVQSPDVVMLREYVETFVDTVSMLLRHQGQTLNASVFKNGGPLTAVGFEVVGTEHVGEVKIKEGHAELRNTLRRLDKLLLERQSEQLYVRRHVRIYERNRFYLVRPSERRFWTKSQARVDADGLIVEWLARSAKSQEVPL